MKYLSKLADRIAELRLAATLALTLAAAALLAGAPPAKAQTYDAVNNVVLQGSLIGGQAAGAVANANSSGTLDTSTAVASATSVNLGNTSSLSTDINATGNVYSDMGGQVNGLVGQLSLIGSQTASATANANAVAATNATALAANIGNSATQRAGVTSVANQH
jgi:hypothetical protein